MDMALPDDLKAEVAKILADRWEVRDGLVVPEPDAVGLGNDIVKLEGTVLYADLAQSTALVDAMTPTFAAEVYKSYKCAARIIRHRGGNHRLRWRPHYGRLRRQRRTLQRRVRLHIAGPWRRGSTRRSGAVPSTDGCDRRSAWTRAIFVARTGIRARTI
jgi:hypothetical protein